MLYNALIAIAGFVLGVRVGLALGYRAERGRRDTEERRWLGELARALGIKRRLDEPVAAARGRILDEARARTPDGEAPVARDRDSEPLPSGDRPLQR